MRRLALKEFVGCFFDGSQQKLTEFLRNGASEEAQAESEFRAGMDAVLL